MPLGLPDPQAVLRGHKGEVQALDFDPSERCLVSGDSLGEVRVWDLADLRPAAIRRLHTLSGGILSLRLFRCAGRQLLGTQGRDGVVLLWTCSGDGLQLSEEPVRSFVRDCYSFCRFDVLWADESSASGSSQPGSGSSGRGGRSSSQSETEEQQQLADAFVAAVLTDEQPSDHATSALAISPAAAAAVAEAQQHAFKHAVSDKQLPDSSSLAAAASSGSGTGAPGSAAIGAAIWALHPCQLASAAQPPALLAIPGEDERTAEVVCAECGQHVAVFREQAAGRKLGMLMAVQLYCCTDTSSAAPKTAAGDAAEAPAAGREPAEAAPAVAPGPEAEAARAAKRPGGLAAALGTHPVAAADTPSPSAAPAPAAAAPGVRICLAAGYEDGSVAVWEVGAAPGAPPLAQRQLCSEPVMSLAMDSSSKGGVCGSAEAQVVCLKVDLAARRLSVRHTIELRGKGKAGVGDVAVRPDRRLLATAGWDGRVRLYKYRSGRPLAVLKYHSSPVTGLRFAPRSMLLATAARDGTLALWPLYQPAEAEEG